VPVGHWADADAAAVMVEALGPNVVAALRRAAGEHAIPVVLVVDEITHVELLTALECRVVTVDKSVLIRKQRGAVVRYRLLETLREFGQDRLRQTGEETAVRRRHRDWCAELVSRAEAEWISPRQVDWFAHLGPGVGKTRLALQVAAQQVPGPDGR
jgi:nucleoside-triphosphatase THEP1